MAGMTPASPEARANSSTRFSCAMRGRRCGRGRAALVREDWVTAGLARSDSILLQPAVERAAAQAQRFRRLADITAIAGQRLAHQQRLYLFQAHIFHLLPAIARPAQPQVA